MIFNSCHFILRHFVKRTRNTRVTSVSRSAEALGRLFAFANCTQDLLRTTSLTSPGRARSGCSLPVPLKMKLAGIFGRRYASLREAWEQVLLGVRICKYVTHSNVNKSICQRQTDWYRISEHLYQFTKSNLTTGVIWRMLNAERDYSLLGQRKYIEA